VNYISYFIQEHIKGCDSNFEVKFSEILNVSTNDTTT